MKRDSSQRLHEDAQNAARRRLTLLLRSAIGRGDFAENRLPREWEIMADTGETRAVVRDSLAQLAAAGVVTREQGLGTRAGILPSVFDLREFHGVDGVPEQSTYPIVTDRTVIPTPPAVDARLPECGPEVLRVEYIAVALEFPGAVSTNYFRFPHAESLMTADFGHNIYAFLDTAGVRLAASQFLIGAAGADPFTASRLHTDTGTALLTMEQTMFDDEGVPFGFSTVAMRGDRVRYFGRGGDTAHAQPS